MMFHEVDTRRRKEAESKHYDAESKHYDVVKESTSEQQRFN